MRLFGNRFLESRYDGGKDSPVTGYWLVEMKNWFSIALLCFNPGHRENYHSHAFNAYTWFLSGSVLEDRIVKDKQSIHQCRSWGPSIIPKYTPKDNCHKVSVKGNKPVWALTFRGPWDKYWYEYNESDDEIIVLTHGRKRVN